MTDKSNDMLGIKPFGDAINTAVTKTFQGVEVFLKATCEPALTEVGQMLKDKVRAWRLQNILKIIEKSKGKLGYENGAIDLKANNKVVLSILENGSNEENDDLQEMWAGLFASSCTKDGKNDENIIYCNILKQLTQAEAKIIKFMAEKSKKVILKNRLPIAQTMSVDQDKLGQITNVKDVTKLEAILNHLNSLRLNDRSDGVQFIGFRKDNKKLIAYLTPTTLALTFFIRCQGSDQTISDYFQITDFV